MSFDAALRVVEQNVQDEAILANLAEASLSAQREEEALPYLIAGAERTRTNARLWQWTALLHRALDDRHEALPAFERAATLLPKDAGIAHGLARTAMEAGLPAVDLFEIAMKLSPGDGGVILGRSAALFAQGQGDAAASSLRNVLTANPLWIDGHKDLAQIRWLLGDRDGFLASVEQALLSNRSAAPLWVLLIQKRVEAKQYDLAFNAIARATEAIGDQPFFLLNEAIIHSETGAVDKADAAFARIGEQRDVSLSFRRVRHDLRNHRLDMALSRIETWLETPQANLFWPYAATIWRMTGDARTYWLEGDDRLVSVLDIRDDLPPLDRLAEVLRSLHTARDQHLDQSVRGGTQTDGVLFARIEPEIRQTRVAITKAVKAHIAQLPPAEVPHPTLTPRRDRSPRFSGSWSVRLPSQGFHVNHVHPDGWLSSALYVSLPDTLGKEGQHDGWFITGCPQEELGLSLPPTRRIEPKPGTLVLFPSTMWHGTVPFDGGERLTIAFDVAAPLA